MYATILFSQWVDHFKTDHNNNFLVTGSTHKECVLHNPNMKVRTEVELGAQSYVNDAAVHGVAAILKSGLSMVLTLIGEDIPEDM